MIVKLLSEHYLEFLSLTRVCRGSSESILVIVSNCWKSHALAQMVATPMTSMCPILLAVISNQDVGKSRQS